MSLQPQAEELLSFWFGPDWDRLPAHQVAERQKALWWSKNPETDALCRTRFEPLVQDAAANRLSDWADTPRSLLALVLLLDQLPRNIYRDTPQAFAFDELARQCTHLALAMGVEQELPAIARVFLYLPLEHSEDIDDQHYVVQLMGALAKAAQGEDKPAFDGYADYARRHLAVIERFGRFPHRNRILGRASSAEESAFLKQPGSSF
ncbi:DUF924 domain-containing protein [Herbaspirillum seropedicae]|uniref:DUF924 domain-containing protein n=1 Tax=Herbaspirillum seropedicae (strain SmR1) TaxID=757424 RepID=D8IQL4_HERSS|nr:DUF924 family protein [Herbaspirillum seropedicae]ADJ65126.1 conserved hypothetical protein [Herbaspirillum seropedicae SmR1]AKN66994.1 hypothetical protein ACP92_18185 [Herbaspirillum seropedicae]NQE27994.1 hypothetical protein [Herbaspirillum seropedicae]UMU22992.1 DUF924 domain-containing protein [Herbaspirillum seropedicae]